MKREVLKTLALKAKNRLIHKMEEPVNVKVIESEDELFYNKVRALLEGDEDIINPIKMLMDESLLMKLDPRSREKYLLETIDKYNEIRKRIARENSLDYGYIG